MDDQKRLDDLESEVQEIRDSNIAMSSNIKEIRDFLVGNEFNKKNGFIAIIEDIKTRLEKVENIFIRGKWLVIGLSMGSGAAAVQLIKWIITTAMTHSPKL